MTVVPSWDFWTHSPGEAIWSEITGADGHHECDWSNCDGKHFFVVLPNGVMVDLSRRASNCTRKDDSTHRCWVIHDGPPVHVDKNGATCSAGAGSIAVDGWHGFLHRGELVG